MSSFPLFYLLYPSTIYLFFLFLSFLSVSSVSLSFLLFNFLSLSYISSSVLIFQYSFFPSFSFYFLPLLHLLHVFYTSTFSTFLSFNSSVITHLFFVIFGKNNFRLISFVDICSLFYCFPFFSLPFRSLFKTFRITFA